MILYAAIKVKAFLSSLIVFGSNTMKIIIIENISSIVTFGILKLFPFKVMLHCIVILIVDFHFPEIPFFHFSQIICIDKL